MNWKIICTWIVSIVPVWISLNRGKEEKKRTKYAFVSQSFFSNECVKCQECQENEGGRRKIWRNEWLQWLWKRNLWVIKIRQIGQMYMENLLELRSPRLCFTFPKTCIFRPILDFRGLISWWMKKLLWLPSFFIRNIGRGSDVLNFDPRCLKFSPDPYSQIHAWNASLGLRFPLEGFRTQTSSSS